MTRQGEGTTIIGQGAKLRGDLICVENLQIDGEVDGTIRVSEARLTIGLDAHVHAGINAQDVVVFGSVEGELRVTGLLELRSTAVVSGKIFAARLSIEENAAVGAQVDLTRAVKVVHATDAIAPPEPAVQTLLPVSAPKSAALFTPPVLAVPQSSGNKPAGLPIAAVSTAPARERKV